MVTSGSATGFAAVVLFSKLSGDHVNIEPAGPLGDPPKVVVSERKIERSGPASAIGNASAVIVTWSVDEQGPSVTVSVNTNPPDVGRSTEMLAVFPITAPCASRQVKAVPPVLPEPSKTAVVPVQNS